MQRKQIAFDLDTKMLEKYYPTENWRKAYEDIKDHMKDNGFQWQQGSVYVSVKSMTTSEVSDILMDLVEQNPWLNKCMRDCRETNIGRSHSKNKIFDKDADIPERDSSKAKESNDKTSKFNIKEMIKTNKEILNNTSTEHKKNKNRGRNEEML